MIRFQSDGGNDNSAGSKWQGSFFKKQNAICLPKGVRFEVLLSMAERQIKSEEHAMCGEITKRIRSLLFSGSFYNLVQKEMARGLAKMLSEKRLNSLRNWIAGADYDLDTAKHC